MTMDAQKSKPIAVIKVGGDMLLSSDDRSRFAENVFDLLNAGWQCVVLHGGGPQVNQLQESLGLKATKIEGRRITKDADLMVVKQALCGQVNVDLTATLIAKGVSALGLHGASGAIIQATKRPPMDMGSQHGIIDFGQVGDVVAINTDLIHTLLNANLVPVIASLGVSLEGNVFNINADTTVSAIACALNADLLIMSTNVGGIFADINDPTSRITKLTPDMAENLIQQEIITDGMIPKVRESIALLTKGVTTIVVANAAINGVFLSLAEGNEQFGTRITL